MSQVPLEDEVKFAFPGDVELPSLDDKRAKLSARVSPPVVLRSVYYDTADRRLVAAGITLRRRTRGGTTTWDLKVPTKPGAIDVRREISLADRSTTPPARLTDILLGWTGGDPLEVVATLRSRRTSWSVRDASDAEVAEIVDDEVEHLDGRRVLTRFREVEIERRGVAESYVRRVARRFVAAGATRADATKLAQVLGVSAAPVRKPRPKDPVLAVLTAALRRSADHLLASDVAVRLDEEDGVHQLRVACRRMRSDLRAYGDVVEPAWRDELSAELKWLGGSLGAARDAEVIADRVARRIADLGPEGERIVSDLRTRRAVADADVAAALRTERYLALARRVRTGLDDPPATGKDEAPAGTAVAKVVDSAWRKVAGAVKKLRKSSPDDEWHAVRIAAKRARYATETGSVVLGDKAARLVRAAEDIQDVLGEFHDSRTAAAALLAVAAERPDDAPYGLAVGRLVEREDAAAVAAQAAFAGVWRDAAEPAMRRWRR